MRFESNLWRSSDFSQLTVTSAAGLGKKKTKSSETETGLRGSRKTHLVSQWNLLIPNFYLSVFKNSVAH